MPNRFNPKTKQQWMIFYMQNGIRRTAYFPTSILAMAFRQKVLAGMKYDASSRASYPYRINS